MQPLTVQRLGTLIQPRSHDPLESRGVINPGGARFDELGYFLFPRHVDDHDMSCVGVAEVLFSSAGLPYAALRQGFALLPGQCYDFLGCEDARVSHVPSLGQYVMTYTGLSDEGPRICLATATDPYEWTKHGPVNWSGPRMGNYHNKDGVLLPQVCMAPDGQTSLALLHRPMWTHRPLDIWISYAPISDNIADLEFGQHMPLLRIERHWEQDRIGAGCVVYNEVESMYYLLYHGVHFGPDGKRVYSVGMALLDRLAPWIVLDRSAEPVFSPKTVEERCGIVPNIVFPTAAEYSIQAGGMIAYYGAADHKTCAALISRPSVGCAHE